MRKKYFDKLSKILVVIGMISRYVFLQKTYQLMLGMVIFPMNLQK